MSTAANQVPVRQGARAYLTTIITNNDNNNHNNNKILKSDWLITRMNTDRIDNTQPN